MTAEMHGVVTRLRIDNKADIDALTTKELLALLVAKDAAKAKEYRKRFRQLRTLFSAIFL